MSLKLEKLENFHGRKGPLLLNYNGWSGTR